MPFHRTRRPRTPERAHRGLRAALRRGRGRRARLPTPVARQPASVATEPLWPRCRGSTATTGNVERVGQIQGCPWCARPAGPMGDATGTCAYGRSGQGTSAIARRAASRKRSGSRGRLPQGRQGGRAVVREPHTIPRPRELGKQRRLTLLAGLRPGESQHAELAHRPSNATPGPRSRPRRRGKTAHEIWPDQPAKARQKNVEARWTIQTGKTRRDGDHTMLDIVIPSFGYPAQRNAGPPGAAPVAQPPKPAAAERQRQAAGGPSRPAKTPPSPPWPPTCRVPAVRVSPAGTAPPPGRRPRPATTEAPAARTRAARSTSALPWRSDAPGAAVNRPGRKPSQRRGGEAERTRSGAKPLTQRERRNSQSGRSGHGDIDLCRDRGTCFHPPGKTPPATLHADHTPLRPKPGTLTPELQVMRAGKTETRHLPRWLSTVFPLTQSREATCTATPPPPRTDSP